MTPQRPYVKLANYLAEASNQVTLPDLDQDLPYFRGSSAQKDNMIHMATAWGYTNGIVIKKVYSEGIMFLHADSIQETQMDRLIMSATNNPDMTTGYENSDKVKWEKLPNIFKAPDYHWLNHMVKKGYRNEENCYPGFNLLVLDVDGSCSLSTAKLLLKKYKAIYYTTKRHTEEENRFRIVLPLSLIHI